MRNIHAVLGPPGCGKTTRIEALIAEEQRAGVSLSQIAILTFTRAARIELEGRLPEPCEWLRTIHAAALRLRGRVRTPIFSDEDWDAFAARYSYELTKLPGTAPGDIEPVIPPRGTPDDVLRYVYDWGRNRCLALKDMLGACPVAGIDVARFELFVRRYEAFKREIGRIDFCDLLEWALADGTALPVLVGFVDEAQDLSELQARVVEKLFARCERVYVAGDDDQAIYAFQGGRADWFMRLARSGTSEVLSQSYRVPGAVKPLADAIIARNTDRLVKPWLAAPRDGRIVNVSITKAMDLVDGSRSTFVLARNRRYLRDHARRLVERGVPYVIEGDGYPNPLGAPRLVRAIEAAVALRDGDEKSVSRRAYADLLRCIAPALATAPHEALVAALRDRGVVACIEWLSEATAAYFDKLLRTYGCVPKPKVMLTSIHGSKGRQAELVVVIGDMTQATHDEYTSQIRSGKEGENRVFYVGVTRTQDTLALVDPKTRRHFNYPTPVLAEVRS